MRFSPFVSLGCLALTGCSPLAQLQLQYWLIENPNGPTIIITGLVISALLGLIPASIARKKGYSYGGFWVFGAFLFIVALPVALLIRNQADQLEESKECPFCAEKIKLRAKVCRFCGREIKA